MENLSHASILDRMDRYVRDWQSAGDRRYIFLSCYRMMTANMLAAIEGNAFHDRDWIRTLLHHFADYYFDALACYDCGETVPPVWRQVHQLTQDDDLHILQYLMMGVNAHINYDLVLTLHDMLEPEWRDLSPEAQKIRYTDHCKVNEIIAGTIDKVQDELLEPSDPVLAFIDRAFGRLDEYLLSRLIRHWREDVWNHTQQMLTTGSAAERETLRQSLEADVIRRGKALSFIK